MGWMAWTAPTAAFFVFILSALGILTVAELIWPTTSRRGFLPLSTTRGDRFFITLLVCAFVHIAWLAVTDAPVYLATIACVFVASVLMRWG